MVRELGKVVLYAAAAVVLLVALIPFVPGSAMISLTRFEVDHGGVAALWRDVTVTHTGDFDVEVSNGHIFTGCNISGRTIFERRDALPVTWDMGCTPPDGEYTVTFCASPHGPLGLQMSPTCIASMWRVGKAGDLGERLDRLQTEVERIREDL